MKAKCKCGHIFEFQATSFTGMVKCPACGKKSPIRTARGDKPQAARGDGPSLTLGALEAAKRADTPLDLSPSPPPRVEPSEKPPVTGAAAARPTEPMRLPPPLVAKPVEIDAVPPFLPSAVEESRRVGRHFSRERPGDSHHLAIGLLSGAVLLLAVVAIVGLVVALRKGNDDAQGKQPDAQKKPLTTEEIVRRSQQSVAMVRGQISIGTGFLASPGILVTNAHVIRREFLQDLEVHFPSAEPSQRGPFAPDLIYQDLSRDIAILSVPAPHKALPLARSYGFRRGQDVTVIGNPSVGRKIVLENAVSKGVMSTETTIDGRRFYQLSISINPGNSGGPVFDSDGKVLGIVTLKARKEEGLAFCIPLEDVQAALTKAKTVSPEERRKHHARHRAVAIFARLRSVGTVYAVSLITYRDAMRDAVKNGLEPGDGVAAARKSLKEKFGDFDEKSLTAGIPPELNTVRSDQQLPQTTRDNLAALWTNYQQMKSYVDNPRGTVFSFHNETNRLTTRYQALVKALLQEFGLPGG